MPAETLLNFAFGSNMSRPRLRARTPSARFVTIGELKGHVLCWHKRSRDGSGKCDVVATGGGNDGVWGVLFEIHRSEKTHLDRAEDLHRGYTEATIEIITTRGRIAAHTYQATDIDGSLRPFDWYKAFVVSGARQHGLPADYVRGLEQVPSIPDPDADRAARNTRLLAAP